MNEMYTRVTITTPGLDGEGVLENWLANVEFFDPYTSYENTRKDSGVVTESEVTIEESSKYENDGAPGFAEDWTRDHPGSEVAIHTEWTGEDPVIEDFVYRDGAAVQSEGRFSTMVPSNFDDLVQGLAAALKVYELEADANDPIGPEDAVATAAHNLVNALKRKG